MKVTLVRQNQAVHLEGQNEEGLRVHTDGSASIGGESKGMRPMELLLTSLGSCSSIDVITILQKMKQPLEDLRIEVEGTRKEGEIPAVFTHIHLHYHLTGALDPVKVARAISLSMETYCSVSKMLEKSVEITTEYSIHPSAAPTV